ncbi:MAG: hypothetical protein R2748_07675 [Bryobacterales bacterium]
MKNYATTTRALCLASLMLASLPLAAQPTINLGPEDGVSFDQIGFDYGNGFAYPFSHWGGMWVAPGTLCESSPIQRGYINVETDRGWVVQNLLVDCQERVLGDDPITAYFQLHDTTDHMTPAEQLGAKVTFTGVAPTILPPTRKRRSISSFLTQRRSPPAAAPKFGSAHCPTLRPRHDIRNGGRIQRIAFPAEPGQCSNGKRAVLPHVDREQSAVPR